MPYYSFEIERPCSKNSGALKKTSAFALHFKKITDVKSSCAVQKIDSVKKLGALKHT